MEPSTAARPEAEARPADIEARWSEAWIARLWTVPFVAFAVSVTGYWVTAWIAGWAPWRAMAAVSLLVYGIVSARRPYGVLRSMETQLIYGYAHLLLSGGLSSSGVALSLSMAFSYVMVMGWTARSRMRLAGYVVGIAALGFLSPLFHSPKLPDHLETFWTIAFLAVSFPLSAYSINFLLASLSAAQGDLRRAREELGDQALARARDLELLSSKLSHELKNPLAAIKSLVDLSLQDAASADERERLQVVHSEVVRMDGIVREYLTFSRPLAVLHREPLELHAVAQETVRALAGRAMDAGVVLSVEGHARVEGDRQRLKEALLNLVANAIEATPPGGAVTVALRRAGDEVHVQVRDTGVGMAPEVVERLGTPFFTTREDGNGLGVLISRRIFSEHGGALTYESAPGRGTTALGVLPVASTEAAAPRA